MKPWLSFFFCFPWRALNCALKESTSAAMSSVLSRSGGIESSTMFSL